MLITIKAFVNQFKFKIHMARISDGIESKISGKARKNDREVEVKGMVWLWCEQKEGRCGEGFHSFF